MKYKGRKHHRLDMVKPGKLKELQEIEERVQKAKEVQPEGVSAT